MVQSYFVQIIVLQIDGNISFSLLTLLKASNSDVRVKCIKSC